MKSKSLLARKLKQLRSCKNVTSEEVALAIGIKPATYRRYEIDTNPKRETFVKLADYFEVPIDYLVSNDEAMDFRVDCTQKYINKETQGISNFELLMLKKIRALSEDKLGELIKFLDSAE